MTWETEKASLFSAEGFEEGNEILQSGITRFTTRAWQDKEIKLESIDHNQAFK